MLDIPEYEALRIIERADPDGGEKEPTDADHDAHRRWAVERFGREVWERYSRGGWGRESDYASSGAWC